MEHVNENPAASAYPGPALPTPNHIRLVSLQPGSDGSITCELFIAEIHANILYEAVSYTWGDPDDRQPVLIKSHEHERPKELLVTSNCVSTLRRLRDQDRPRILWIDTLSIDQSNLAERNHQVSLMAAIYSNATNVAIYLGEASENSELAIDFIMECDQPSSNKNSLSYVKSESLIQALYSFFFRPWFTRVWVIQEVILPATGTAYCGNKTLSWSTIKHFNRWNTTKKWLQQLPFVVSAPKAWPKEHLTEPPMLNLLIQARRCEATDPRDKIYSMLSLLGKSDKQFGIKPRYEDAVAKVYTDCALALMAGGGYNLLSAVQGGSTIEGLPSWVPDWSVQQKREILGTNLRIARNRPRIFEKQAGILKSPQIILDESTKGSARLRVAGYTRGKITKMGSVYLAGQGPFPLQEWKSLLQDDAVVSRRRANVAPGDYHANDENDSLFYEVISTYVARYEHAILLFVKTEQAPEGGASALSWESRVKQMAAQAAQDSLPFTDIPFRLAAGDYPPSFQLYVQDILKYCHSRRFFITDAGYTGIGPEGMEIGDQLYICAGAAVSFVFRDIHNGDAQSNKIFQLVGECYADEKAWKDLEDRIGSPQYFDIA
ncbi:heterokaryon incompatibility domain-containing protein [Trichoderma austrokoningii]